MKYGRYIALQSLEILNKLLCHINGKLPPYFVLLLFICDLGNLILNQKKGTKSLSSLHFQ